MTQTKDQQGPCWQRATRVHPVIALEPDNDQISRIDDKAMLLLTVYIRAGADPAEAAKNIPSLIETVSAVHERHGGTALVRDEGRVCEINDNGAFFVALAPIQHDFNSRQRLAKVAAEITSAPVPRDSCYERVIAQVGA